MRRHALLAALLLTVLLTGWAIGGAEDERTRGEKAPPADASAATAEGADTEADPHAEAYADAYADAREALVRNAIVGAGIGDPAVIRAMRTVPRHEFVLPENVSLAYRDTALPIIAGQTISQPYVVAFMTEVLELDPDDRVLEVGTGSGYQAAVLAEIVESVFTIEIIRVLADTAVERLRRLGYDNITVVHGDGYYGLPDAAPFDAVIVTAAAGHVPPPLVKQLRPGGRMVIPVGPVYSVQVLILVTREPDGSVTTRQLLPVRFVPMTGEVQGARQTDGQTGDGAPSRDE